MATALVTRPIITTPEATRTPSPLTRALIVATACVVAVWAAMIAILVLMTETSALGAIGVGAYAAFWLGGGFGAIFGSAAAFGQDH